jgi:hypothetical protein
MRSAPNVVITESAVRVTALEKANEPAGPLSMVTFPPILTGVRSRKNPDCLLRVPPLRVNLPLPPLMSLPMTSVPAESVKPPVKVFEPKFSVPAPTLVTLKSPLMPLAIVKLPVLWVTPITVFPVSTMLPALIVEAAGAELRSAPTPPIPAPARFSVLKVSLLPLVSKEPLLTLTFAKS